MQIGMHGWIHRWMIELVHGSIWINEWHKDRHQWSKAWWRIDGTGISWRAILDGREVVGYIDA
jgi:hypothetical protein